MCTETRYFLPRLVLGVSLLSPLAQLYSVSVRREIGHFYVLGYELIHAVIDRATYFPTHCDLRLVWRHLSPELHKPQGVLLI